MDTQIPVYVINTSCSAMFVVPVHRLAEDQGKVYLCYTIWFSFRVLQETRNKGLDAQTQKQDTTKTSSVAK